MTIPGASYCKRGWRFFICAGFSQNLFLKVGHRIHRLATRNKTDHLEKNRIRIADQIIPISDTYSDGFYKKLRGLI
ncbi:hypothetical protein [Pontibacter indicus]|uniref:hypothetical protein n=1 Tax=Pontibacter indicus TaxID=1317125 RepID=UPI001BAE5DA3|nr:hypothetical protein [Pontibacter indicus]